MPEASTSSTERACDWTLGATVSGPCPSSRQLLLYSPCGCSALRNGSLSLWFFHSACSCNAPATRQPLPCRPAETGARAGPARAGRRPTAAPGQLSGCGEGRGGDPDGEQAV